MVLRPGLIQFGEQYCGVSRYHQVARRCRAELTENVDNKQGALAQRPSRNQIRRRLQSTGPHPHPPPAGEKIQAGRRSRKAGTIGAGRPSAPRTRYGGPELEGRWEGRVCGSLYACFAFSGLRRRRRSAGERMPRVGSAAAAAAAVSLGN